MSLVEIRKIPRADGSGVGLGRFEELKAEQKDGNGNKVREPLRLEIKMWEPLVCWTIVFEARGPDGIN